MSMLWSVTKPALLRRLKRWGGFTSETSLARFYEATITACTKIRREGDWDWKRSNAEITTTAGLLGPYDAPATFYRMALEKKIYAYGYGDSGGQVMAPVLSTDTQAWEVVFRVATGKLHFRSDPGAGVVIFNFVPMIDNNPTDANAQAMVELMPGNLFDILADFIEADFLGESKDTKADGALKFNEASINLRLEFKEFQKGANRQRQRSPRGVAGVPFDGIGAQTNLRGRGGQTSRFRG